MTPDETIKWMLGECAVNLRKLTPWERNFVESVSEQFDNRGQLTEWQMEILEGIYQKV